jgi:alanine dehydrogenase
MIARKGWREACRADPALALGLAVHEGQVVSEPVGVAHGLPATGLGEVLA